MAIPSEPLDDPAKTQIQFDLPREEYEALEKVATEKGLSVADARREATSLYARRKAEIHRMMDGIFSRAEAAATAEVSIRTIDQWLADGLAHSKIGGLVRINVDDLLRWITDHRTTR